MNRPNFLLVGAPRCGTTAMYLYLKQHPEMFLSVFKEPHFFGSDLTIQPHTIRDPHRYENLFQGAGRARRIGEGSVWYLRSKCAAREIYDFNPRMKILIMLRDPVEMISSLHALYLRTGNENLDDLEAALDAEPARAAGLDLPEGHYFPEGLQYRGHAAYDEQVPRYLELFGLDQVHVVLHERFRQAPLEVLASVASFLDIDPHVQPELDLEKARKRIRSLVLRQLRQVHPDTRSKLQRWNLHHEGPRRPVPKALRQRLVAEFEVGIRRLAERLGQDLSAWLEV